MQFEHPKAARRAIREGRWTGPTAGICPDYVQANLVIMPKEQARDFERFCQLNAKPCPLLEKTHPGDPHLHFLSQDTDLRTDIPRYRVFADGVEIASPTDIQDLWQNNLVSFLLGCSFSFEKALIDEGISLRHIEEGKNVAMYDTHIANQSVGVFGGNMVVSMRPIKKSQLDQVVRITREFPFAHGGPVHIGDPRAIGIADINRPDYGDQVAVLADEIPVFWACGVTPQKVIMASKIPLAITHSPGCMFISDVPASEFEKLKT